MLFFLGFLPGWLIIRLLKLDNLDTTSKFVLTVGLSQVFVIFFGLIVNQISLYFGYLHPLNENVLTITFSLALIFMAVILNFIGMAKSIITENAVKCYRYCHYIILCRIAAVEHSWDNSHEFLRQQHLTNGSIIIHCVTHYNSNCET